jgi:hypothetical protein
LCEEERGAKTRFKYYFVALPATASLRALVHLEQVAEKVDNLNAQCRMQTRSMSKDFAVCILTFAF